MPPDKLDEKDRADVPEHFRTQLAEVLTKRGARSPNRPRRTRTSNLSTLTSFATICQQGRSTSSTT
jgi:hypothetical protein